MKLADAFGKAQLSRVILPGFIVSVGLHPHVASLFNTSLGQLYGLSSSVLFIIEIGFFGLILSSLSTLIFYILEGFHWPWLTQGLKSLNRRRLARIEKDIKDVKKRIKKVKKDEKDRLQDRLDLLEMSRDDYPLDENGQAFVERPTRLTNLIASYELYPESRYEVDGTFFWYHILSFSEDSARAEFHEKVREAESLVLMSAAGALVGLVGLVFLLGMGVGHLGEGYTFFWMATPVFLGWLELVVGFLISVFFYYLALPVYRDTAERFRALVDLSMPNFLEWLKDAPTARPDEKQRMVEDNVRMYLGSLDSLKDK